MSTGRAGVEDPRALRSRKDGAIFGSIPCRPCPHGEHGYKAVQHAANHAFQATHHATRPQPAGQQPESGGEPDEAGHSQIFGAKCASSVELKEDPVREV